MKKTLLLITICALTLAGFNSCKKVEALIEPENTSYQVNFRGEIQDLDAAPGTKGLALVALPDWRNTDESHIHLFENGVEGTDPTMSVETKNNKVAYFSATFGESQGQGGGDEFEDVDIDAPLNTKAGDMYEYNAIIAPGEEGVYTVPAVQTPDTEVSLIDPSADFLIGCTKQIGARYSDGTPIKLDFKRPVSIFRFAIICIDKSEKIQEVVLTTDKEITGSFRKSDVNFNEGTASFDKTGGSKSITLKYNDLAVETIFYAYFVACPTTSATIKSIVVKTDKTIYTYESSAVKTLSSTVFNSWAIDMTGKGVARGEEGGEEGGDEEKTPQTLSFGSTTEFDHIIGASDFTEPTLSGAKTTVTYSITTVPGTGVATINSSTGKVTFGSTAGTAVVTATAAENDTYEEGTASYTINIAAPSTKATYYKASAIEAGHDYLIVSGDHALKNKNGSPAAVDVLEFESSNKIEMEEDETLLWRATKPTTELTEGTFTFTNNGKSFYRISNESDQNLGIGTIPEPLTKYYLWDYISEHVTHTSTHSSSTNYYWFYYDSGWKISYDDVLPSNNKTEIYETRQPQTVSFSSTSATYDMNGNVFTKPTLSGAQGTVTYTSSDETVATVDASGNITAKKKGTATITANVAGTSTYQAASASYELTVVNSSVVATTYYKAAAIESGYSYLIVSNGKALKNGISAVSVSESNDKIVLEDDSDLLWTATHNNVDESYGEYTLSYGTKYLYRSSNSLKEGSSSDINKYYVWSYDGAYLENHSNYAYCSTSDTEWKTSSADDADHSSSLYETRQPQTVSFNNPSAEIDLANTGAFTKPTFTKQAADGNTEYTSSDPTVATVSSTGDITPLKKGTTTITATAKGSSTYQAASASYELTVVNSSVVATTYYKAAAIESGYSYLIVSDGKALKRSSGDIANESVTINENKIVLEDDTDLLWTASYNTYDTSAGEYTLTNGNYYLYRSSTSLKVKTSPSIEEHYVWSYDGTYVTTENYYLYYSSSSKIFKLNTSKEESLLFTSRQPQTVSFSSTSATYDLNGNVFTKPTLSGAQGTVTYTSSDETVATVDASGNITAKKKGSTTITANVAGTSTYQAASASYKLTVTNSSATTKYYVKVSSQSDLPTSTSAASGNYLIVYEDGDNAYVFKGIGTPKGAGDQSSGHNNFETDGSAVKVDLTNDGIAVTEEVQDCEIQLQRHKEKVTWYIYVNRVSGWLRIDEDLEAMESSGYGSTFKFSGTGNNLELSNSSKYFIFSTSNKQFKGSDTSSKVSLYMLDE